MGKLAGRILQTRLQGLAECVLPESQCGFRVGRSCTDAIFSVRQLVEKTREHRAKLFCVFVDLRKAYDSVPRAALWLALQKLGVPPRVVSLIESFHDDMMASVRAAGGLTDPIQVKNGLRQGCVMAPVLFNLFFGLVVQRWQVALQEHSVVGGVDMCYRINGDLFPRVTRQVYSQTASVLDFEFADDAVLFASSRRAAELSLECFWHVASSFGLSVNAAKTEFFVAGHTVTEEDCEPMIIDGKSIACVPSFVYLGSVITPDARSSFDVKRRLAKGAQAFGTLRKVFLDKHLSLTTKRHLYGVSVLPVVLYGSECWTPLKRDLQQLDYFHHNNIRTILAVSRAQQWNDHVTNAELRERWGDLLTLSDKLRCRRLEWLGHLARMPDDRVPKQLLFATLPKPRPFCGPQRRWKDVATADLHAAGIANWYTLASNRLEWRVLTSAPVAADLPSPSISCDTCHRVFRRPGDLARHKCLAERRLPVDQQSGAVQCSSCSRWFRSKGGLAVHHCSSASSSSSTARPSGSSTGSQRCENCLRTFRSVAGLRRHRCGPPQRPDCSARALFVYECTNCSRRFRRAQDLNRHAASCSPPPPK